MDTPSPSLQHLARQVLALEAAHTPSGDAASSVAARVVAKFGTSLTRFAGPEGFSSLLRRALALAGREVPSLARVTLKPDGSLEGLESLAAEGSERAEDATVALTVHMLGLLVTFVGEPLTLRLVREAWPDATLN